ncbi:MAG: TIGR04551 family protein [Kofleriaceae bacterium]
MLVRHRRLASFLAGPAVALTLVAGAARAQSALPTGGPPTGGEEDTKPKGAAEAAPKSASLVSTTPAVPARRDSRKKYDVVKVDGYLRARGDWAKNWNLGFADDPAFGGAPYPQPLVCRADAATRAATCGDTIKSSNLRLRLEPRLELTNTIAVHTQIDLLDNLVLGSTPGGQSPLGAFSGGAVPPEAGVNSDRNSIVVRRAWGEVSTALFHLKFGRMPDHFGLGLVANSGRRADTDYATWETLWAPGAEANVGGANDIGYDLDSDYGDTVDRAMATLDVPGTPLRAMIALDWQGAGVTSDQVDTARTVGGQPWDLGDADDTNQWTLGIAKMEAPADFREEMDRGKLALDFGGRLTRRSQSVDYDLTGVTVGDAADGNKLVARGMSMYIGDAWLKLGWKGLLVEVEAAGMVGSIDALADFGYDGALDIRSFGGVARAHGKAFDAKLGYGLELGLATGDDADNPVEGRTNLRNASLIPQTGDHTMSRFVFDPDYKVDLILFRELIGAVSNAFYVRPQFSYQLTKAINVKLQNVTSAALKPVSTPGNATFWGTEFDADLGYASNGFSAGLAYGVLFPLGAMDHPTGTSGGTGFPFGDNNQNAGSSANAHTFQARLGIEF